MSPTRMPISTMSCIHGNRSGARGWVTSQQSPIADHARVGQSGGCCLRAFNPLSAQSHRYGSHSRCDLPATDLTNTRNARPDDHGSCTRADRLRWHRLSQRCLDVVSGHRPSRVVERAFRVTVCQLLSRAHAGHCHDHVPRSPALTPDRLPLANDSRLSCDFGRHSVGWRYVAHVDGPLATALPLRARLFRT